jgi:hypothetical protein
LDRYVNGVRKSGCCEVKSKKNDCFGGRYPTKTKNHLKWKPCNDAEMRIKRLAIAEIHEEFATYKTARRMDE